MGWPGVSGRRSARQRSAPSWQFGRPRSALDKRWREGADLRCPVPVQHSRNILCVFPPTRRPSALSRTRLRSCLAYARSCRPKVCLSSPPICPSAGASGSSTRIFSEPSPRTLPGPMWFSSAACTFSCLRGPRHPAARQILRQAHCARRFSRLESPETYPEFDYLHLGEIGDATDQLIATLDESGRSVLRPNGGSRRGIGFRCQAFRFRFTTPCRSRAVSHRLAAILKRLPISLRILRHSCLYGRQPRFKSPEQLLAELDAFVSQPDHPPVIYLVDDNFIGNRKRREICCLI